MNFIMLLLGLAAIMTFFYDLSLSFFNGNEYERYALLNRMTGPYKFRNIILLFFPLILSQLYWIKRIRYSEFISAVLSVIMILTISFSLYFDLSILFHRDYLPSSWNMFFPSFEDLGIFLGTMFFPLTSFILIILLYKQIRSIALYVRKPYKNKKIIGESRRSFMISIFEKFKK